MGNHDVGRAIAAGARGFWHGANFREITKEEAITALDSIAKPFRGADAEFDDELDPDTPTGQLLIIAFGPYTEPDPQDDGQSWYDNIVTPFRQRYDFY